MTRLLAILWMTFAVPVVGRTAVLYDDFSSGNANWEGPAGIVPPTLPTGGPLGVGDAFLAFPRDGSNGANGKLILINTMQWTIDFPAAGATECQFYARSNLSFPLTLYLLIRGSGGDICSVAPVTLPADGAWHLLTWGLEAPAFQLLSGSSISATLSSNTMFRIVYNTAPNFAGLPVTGRFDFDKITYITGPTSTQTPSNTFTSTVTPIATRTPSPSFTVSFTATPSASPSATHTPSPTGTLTQSPTPTRSPTATPSATPTWTPSPTATSSPTCTRTSTQSRTSSATATASPSVTLTSSTTSSPSPSGTLTQSPTATLTSSATWSPTATESFTSSPTANGTFTITPTVTETITPIPTDTPAYAKSGLDRSGLAPVPAYKEQALCLYFKSAPHDSAWAVYNVAGECVARLSFGSESPQCWNHSNVAAGIYLVRLKINTAAGYEERVQKVVFLP